MTVNDWTLPGPSYQLSPSSDSRAALAIAVFSDELDESAEPLQKAALQAGRFTGEPGETYRTVDSADRFHVAVGLGRRTDLDLETLRIAAAALTAEVDDQQSVEVGLLGPWSAHLDHGAAVQAVVEGLELGRYRFDRYKSRPEPHQLTEVFLLEAADCAQHVVRGQVVAAAVGLTRDLVNEPAHALVPSDFAELAVSLAMHPDLTTRVRSGADLAAHGFGAVIGVGQGSDHPPQVLELDYHPAGAEISVALVGKGITFDSGGLNLKSLEQMEWMKGDMAGAATVLAATLAAAELAIPVRVVTIVPLAENSPGPGAVRPGDVLTTYDGTTVEVLNTDAEGRLVLADALALAAEMSVDAVIDVATLTRGAHVALGNEISAVLSNDPELSALVCAVATECGEPMWALPLPDRYERFLRSPIADLRNTGRTPNGGALLAGLFLQRFVADRPWVHLDIAGTAMVTEERPGVAHGGTGVGLRTLVATLQAIGAGRWSRDER